MQPSPSTRAKTLLVYGLLLVGVCLVFGQTANFKFVEFDDPDYVYQNPFVNRGVTLRGVVWAFTRTRAANWHPLTWISHMLDCQFGVDPGRQHVTNFVLHGVSACLLFTLLLRLSKWRDHVGWAERSESHQSTSLTVGLASSAHPTFWPCAAIAAFFAVHPLRVESVAWIAERKDILGGLFFFLTLLAYEGYARHGTTGRFLLATLFFILGLLSKPMLVTLPFVALLLDFWPLQRFRQAVEEENSSPPSYRISIAPLIVEKLLWFILSAASCAITIYAQGRAVSTLDRLPAMLRLENAVISYVAYIGQMFWPENLAVFYPHAWKSPPFWAVGGAIALLAGISIVVILLRKRCPYLLFGWLWYLGTLVPVIGLVQVGRQAMADRYTYLPHIGLYLAIVFAAADAVRRWPATRAAVSLVSACVLAASITAAWHQTTFWHDNLALWTRAVSCTPENAIALNNLASALFNAGEPVDASADVERAIAAEPNFALAYYNRGRLLAHDGKRKQAIEAIKHAVEFEPNSPVTQNDLAMLLFADHQPREAVKYLDHVLELDPHALEVMENLAWVLATTAPQDGGDPDRAVALAEHVCRALPSPGCDELDVLAAAYASAGRYEQAGTIADRAIKLAIVAGRYDLAGKIGDRKKLYEAKRPYRD